MISTGNKDFNIKINSNSFRNELRYVFGVFANNQSLRLVENESGVSIGENTLDSPLPLSQQFIQNYTNQRFAFKENLNNNGFITHADGTPDFIATAFYMLGCLQEYDRSKKLDSLGRFQFKNSYQSELEITYKNLVQYCFDRIAEKLNLKPQSVRTRFYLSHDIDSVYGSLLQDGYYAIKRGRIDIFLLLLFKVAIQKPDWLNIDKIMELETLYDCKSTFFWLVQKGKTDGLKNSDYDFNSSHIQKHYNEVTKRGFENGIHKSTSTESFATELKKFNDCPISNRYHYLKFGLPQGYDSIEQSGLRIDATLGFAECIGFRNNYGMPYQPYNLKERRPYSFIEVPLHVMDATFFNYLKKSPTEACNDIIRFFEANKENCVLSVLWHNNFFTNYKYKGYLELYKEILAYIKDNNFKTINQQEIIDQYSLPNS